MKTDPINPRFTYGDYVQWTGDDRWELIDGVAFSMTPSPRRIHQELLGNLYLQIATFLRGHRCRVYLAPFDVRLPDADEPDADVRTVVQPDLSVVCDTSKLDDAGCRGAPDWIIEISSPRTSARDQLEKRDLYERHGVGEYWTVDPKERRFLVFRLDPATRRYGTPLAAAAEGKTPVVTLPGLAIDWQEAFGDQT
ncbi:MAG TPA: Uma2 family endonuclease [Thermoanaerobaculia bacterium]|nr:Uma2 family endonuclease [Thermoanaerobaculia bacterium]